VGVKRPGNEGDHSSASSAEVKNAWSYISTLPIRFHSVVLSFLEKQRDNFTFTGTYLSFFPLLFTLNVILPFTLSLTILVSAWLGKKKEYTSFTGANKGKNIDLFFVSLLIYSYLFLYFVLFFSSSFTYFFYSLSLSVSICVPNGISSTPDIRANTSIARSRSPQPWCTT